MDADPVGVAMNRLSGIAELPPPPPERSGWPWTLETTPLPFEPAVTQALPRITIVTPSSNQGRYLEETLRSVLLQGYENLEYFVMDAGSEDETLEILERYSPWIRHWESKPDRGQSHAINKGWGRASGDVLAWLNSDDLYAPGALAKVGAAFAQNPDTLIAGAVVDFNDKTGELREPIHSQDLSWQRFIRIWEGAPPWHQPGLFFPRTSIQTAGMLDESLHLCMDRDLMIRVLRDTPVTYLPDTLAHFRRHPEAKTTRATYRKMLGEKLRIVATYEDLLHEPDDLDARCRFWISRCGHELVAGRPLLAVSNLRRALSLGAGRTLRMASSFASRSRP